MNKTNFKKNIQKASEIVNIPDFLEKNKDISKVSNFKTKAVAKYYFEINNKKDIYKLYEINKFIINNSLKLLIISGGTNVLFAFNIYEGVIIKNNLLGYSFSDKNNKDIKNNKELEVYSGENISDIAESLEKDYKINIWHRFIGLPGAVGGALYGNAGCFGLEIENNFKEALVFDFKNNKFITLTKKDLNFSYRFSVLKENKNLFIVKAIFDLSYISEKYSSDIDNIDFRENKQPKGNSCGSFFKNHSREFPSAKLLEECGLRGFRYNTAYFSDLHSNFLMCDTGGNYKDLLYLINLAKTKVFSKFNIKIQPEVQIIK